MKHLLLIIYFSFVFLSAPAHALVSKRVDLAALTLPVAYATSAPSKMAFATSDLRYSKNIAVVNVTGASICLDFQSGTSSSAASNSGNKNEICVVSGGTVILDDAKQNMASGMYARGDAGTVTGAGKYFDVWIW